MSVLKRNAGWHALTMLVTGVSAFLGIVLTKQLLPEQSFVYFNVKLNAVLMINVVTISWLTVGMFRMIHRRGAFFRADNLIFLALVSVLVAGLPGLGAWYLSIQPKGSMIWPFVLQVLVTVHSVLLVAQQASLNAKKASVGEAVRSSVQTLFLIGPFFLEKRVSQEYCMLVWIGAYAAGIIFFLFLARKAVPPIHTWRWNITARYKLKAGEIFKFGFPYTVFILLTHLLLNTDRWYILHQDFPAGTSSDYFAIADTMMRGTSFMFMPLNTSAFPVISALHDQGKSREVMALLKRIVGIQLLLIAGSVLALVLLQDLFFAILTVDSLAQPLGLSLLLLIFHSVWLSGYILQKPAEMMWRMNMLSFILAFSLLIYYALLWWVVVPTTFTGVVLCLAVAIVIYIGGVLVYVRKLAR